MHIPDIQAIAGQLVTVDLYGQYRQAGRLLNLDIGRTVRCFQNSGNFCARFLQLRHIVAKHLDGYIAAYPGNQLVEAQLDRLRKLITASGNLEERVAHGGDEFVTRFPGCGPLVFRL